MDLESPASYGEKYWASQREAAIAFEEDMEKSIKGFIPSLFTDPDIRASVPFDILPKLESLLQFEHPGLGDIGGRFVSEAADNVVGKLLDSALKNFGWSSNKFFADEHVTAAEVTTLLRRKKISAEFAVERMGQWGYSSGEQLVHYEASAPYPPLADLMRWGRYFAGEELMFKAVETRFDVPQLDQTLWAWLSEQQYTTDQITGLMRRGVFTMEQADDWLRRLGWAGGRAADIIELGYVLPNAMILLQGNLQAEAPPEEVTADLGKADIHPAYQQKYFDAVLTKPASIDLIQYHLRQDNDLVGLPRDLARIGLHPAYTDVYRTLAYPIPPTADLIAMAVREAFSPEIAAQFGQYEDFPADFAKYARQKGLSEEWAKRYWAAHWNLPSPQQGFAMLHRGVITIAELNMLLRAQDVMPFWRDKLVEIAYRPLTRVDVRRMYKEGVLEEEEVFAAYKDQGYAEENAQALTEYTIKMTLSSMAKFSSTHVLAAYADGIITESDAAGLLSQLGVRSDDRSVILSWAKHKREWEYTQDRIAAIGNFYRRGEYSESDAQRELGRLNLPSEQVTVLMDKWWHEEKEKARPTWTKAETLKFMRTELITEQRGIEELQRIGYDEEHIDVYLKSIA